MSSVQTSIVPVPGAALYCKWRGEGPWLVIVQGGAGDADVAEALADELCAHYRVLTYDRRGLSRSRIDCGGGVSRIEEHADDVHRLLGALGVSAACVFGVSIGAIVGLDLLARYPEDVQLLVAQEPPLAYLLPAEPREQALRMQEDLETTLHRDGAEAALRKFMLALDVDFRDLEPGFKAPKNSPFVLGNYDHFLRYDAPSVRRYRLDLHALAREAAKIVLAIGARCQENLVKGERGAALKVGPALALAERLGVELRVFPGGHGGYTTHPRSYAARLLELLVARARAVRLDPKRHLGP